MNTNTKRLNVFDPDQEAKAFIYQQVHILSQFLPGASSVVVLTRMFESQKRPQYYVEMVADVHGQTLKLGARSLNLFDAIIKVRNRMGSVLSAVRNVVDATPERDQQIQTLLYFSGSVH